MFRALLIAACLLFSGASYAAPILLTDANTIVLKGQVNSKSVSQVITALMRHRGDVYLYISSPGGSVRDGLDLIDAIDAYGPQHVSCISDLAASMGFSIFQACGKRYVTEDAILMQHDGSFSIEGQRPHVVSYMALILSMLDRLNTLDAARLGVSVNDFKALIDKDYWLFGDQAVAAKAADKVVTVMCSDSMAAGTHTEEVQQQIFTLLVKLSNCPLVTAPLSISLKGHEGPLTKEMLEALETYKESLNGRDAVLSGQVNGLDVP